MRRIGLDWIGLDCEKDWIGLDWIVDWIVRRIGL